MAKREFTVLLDKREGQFVKGAELGSATLKGSSIYKEGVTGLADSIEAVLEAGSVHVPTYALIGGRAFADASDEAWSQWHDSCAERITAYDAKGILGEKGRTYALDIQNGGLFVRNPQRIRKDVEGRTLVNGALQFEQEEIDILLDAVKKKDYTGLRQIVLGGNAMFAGTFGEFVEASEASDFIKAMDTTYLVVRPVEEARALPSDRRVIGVQRNNPDLIIASGGKRRLENMLDKAQLPNKDGGIGLDKFGSWHDGYNNKNTGRVVFLGVLYYGVYGSISLYDGGRSVGVAPEALDAFYRQKDVDPLALKINQAMRTSKPVEHAGGVILYVPQVCVKQ